MNIINIFLLLLAFAVILRIVPHLFSPGGSGIDHWFWKKYIEIYRHNRQFPPVIPQYKLDQYQWYPPLFPILMSKVPEAIFDRWNYLLAISIDLARMIFLLSIAYWLTAGNLSVVTLSGLIYATTPILISYNFQLNPRVLAALFLDGILISLLWYYSYAGPWWVWVIVILLSALILLTHKMTTQLFWFICLCCAVIYHWYFLFLIPISIVGAILLSRGFYIKVLIAHWDIVKFWWANWRWIGADAIRESPIYGTENYQRSVKLHKKGLKGFVWYFFLLFGFNPAAWIACLLVFERIFIEPHVLIYSTWLIVWLLIPCLLALLTTFIPYLRCIGAGYLYLYNTSIITSLLLAMAFCYSKTPTFSFPYWVYSAALFFNCLSIIFFYIKFFNNKRSRIDRGFNQILQTLKTLPLGTVWCIPSGWHEPVAYKTSHPVLWGAHGYGFKNLLSTFPRLLLPINIVIKQYQVRYLLTMEGLLTPQCLIDMPSNQVIREDNYLLFIFN